MLYMLPLIACFLDVFTDIKRERYDVVEYIVRAHWQTAETGQRTEIEEVKAQK